MKRYPLRSNHVQHRLHAAAPILADRINERLSEAAPLRHDWPGRVRDGKPYAIQRTATITLSLALVDKMLREGAIEPGDLLDLVDHGDAKMTRRG